MTNPTTQQPERLIVALNSRKGGVGKTTLALAIALEVLEAHAGRDGLPVVLVDADIFGSEVADALLPFEPGSPPTWDLGLMEILVQSTGGDVTMGTLLRRRLEVVRRRLEEGHEEVGLPLVRFSFERDSNVPLLVIPSTLWRDPAKRVRPGGSSIEHSVVAESVGRIQVELRLTALVDAIIEVFEPRLILLDNAPFHLPLSGLWERLGHREAREDLLYGRNTGDRWSRYAVRGLEVVGPEEQDIFPFLADLVNDDRRVRRFEDGWRWVINRDVHWPGRSGPDGCNTHVLLSHPSRAATALAAASLVPELGHVMLSPALFAGAHGANTSLLSMVRSEAEGGVGFEFSAPGEPVSYPTRLRAACQHNRLAPRVFDRSKKLFVIRPWMDFLSRA